MNDLEEEEADKTTAPKRWIETELEVAKQARREPFVLLAVALVTVVLAYLFPLDS